MLGLIESVVLVGGTAVTGFFATHRLSTMERIAAMTVLLVGSVYISLAVASGDISFLAALLILCSIVLLGAWRTVHWPIQSGDAAAPADATPDTVVRESRAWRRGSVPLVVLGPLAVSLIQLLRSSSDLGVMRSIAAFGLGVAAFVVVLPLAVALSKWRRRQGPDRRTGR